MIKDYLNENQEQLAMTEMQHGPSNSPKRPNHRRTLAAAFPVEAFVQEALAQIPRYHAITIVEKVRYAEMHVRYVRRVIENGWPSDRVASFGTTFSG